MFIIVIICTHIYIYIYMRKDKQITEKNFSDVIQIKKKSQFIFLFLDDHVD